MSSVAYAYCSMDAKASVARSLVRWLDIWFSHSRTLSLIHNALCSASDAPFRQCACYRRRRWRRRHPFTHIYAHARIHTCTQARVMHSIVTKKKVYSYIYKGTLCSSTGEHGELFEREWRGSSFLCCCIKMLLHIHIISLFLYLLLLRVYYIRIVMGSEWIFVMHTRQNEPYLIQIAVCHWHNSYWTECIININMYMGHRNSHFSLWQVFFFPFYINGLAKNAHTSACHKHFSVRMYRL